jgi:3-oxo-4,17-pregnadiene-20-carboxyl-CoA hydratase alpha subunit
MPSRPVRSRDELGFWEGADRHQLVIQRCADCGTRRHPPSPMCGACGSLATDYEASSGRGRVLSWMLSHHPNRPDDPPTVVILVELEEGIRVVSNLVDPPGPGPYEDLTVEVDFADQDDAVIPVFRASP